MSSLFRMIFTATSWLARAVSLARITLLNTPCPVYPYTLYLLSNISPIFTPRRGNKQHLFIFLKHTLFNCTFFWKLETETWNNLHFSMETKLVKCDRTIPRERKCQLKLKRRWMKRTVVALCVSPVVLEVGVLLEVFPNASSSQPCTLQREHGHCLHHTIETYTQ